MRSVVSGQELWLETRTFPFTDKHSAQRPGQEKEQIAFLPYLSHWGLPTDIHCNKPTSCVSRNGSGLVSNLCMVTTLFSVTDSKQKSWNWNTIYIRKWQDCSLYYASSGLGRPLRRLFISFDLSPWNPPPPPHPHYFCVYCTVVFPHFFPLRFHSWSNEKRQSLHRRLNCRRWDFCDWKCVETE